MGFFNDFVYEDRQLEQEGLHINKRKGRVKAALSTFKFRDKDTGQWVICLPSLELSGYGETEEKALEMLRFSTDQLLTHLASLNPEELHQELSALGWKKNAFRAKEFSKAFIDINGELQGMNIEGKVERMTLVA